MKGGNWMVYPSCALVNSCHWPGEPVVVGELLAGASDGSGLMPEEVDVLPQPVAHTRRTTVRQKERPAERLMAIYAPRLQTKQVLSGIVTQIKRDAN